LGVDVSYVSRIARGQRKSKVAEKALTREFNKAVAIMSSGLPRSTKRPHTAVKLACPRCKTQQNVHVAKRLGFGQMGSERVSCINCDHRFKKEITDRIIGGPFPA
jgi:DNA-directed RNA polymerase subunit M/transcription elongation factor TFIIS